MRIAFLAIIFGVFAFTTIDLTVAKLVHQDDDKRTLEHEDYDRWNTISGTTISADGNWIMYTLLDGKDVTTVKVRNTNSRKEYTIKNGARPRLSYDSKHVAYKVSPDKELIKRLKKKNKDETELPKEKFEILNLETGNQHSFDQVQSFLFPKKSGDWIAIHLEKPGDLSTVEKQESGSPEVFQVTPEGLKRPRKSNKKKSEQENSENSTKTAEPGSNKTETNVEKSSSKNEGDEQDMKDDKKKEPGSTLVLLNLGTGMEKRIPFVLSYRFDKLGKSFSYVTSTKDNAVSDGVWIVDLNDGTTIQIVSGLGNYKNLAFDERGRQLSFVTDRDDYDSKDSSWVLYHWKKSWSAAKSIVSEATKGIPKDWRLSSTAAPFFSENGKYLFCYTSPKPENVDDEGDEKDADDAEPTAKLDIWHWQDPLLQPQQLIQAEQEKNRSYVASYNLRTRKLVQLATKEVPEVFVDSRNPSEMTVGISDTKYKKAISWDLPGFRDAYLVDVKTGEQQMALEQLRSQPRLSPNGKFLFWWDTRSRNWFSMSTKDIENKKNISETIEFSLFDELHDTPSDPRPYGIAGWTDRDQRVLIYDRYDIWALDPNGESAPLCVTNSIGRKNKTRFRYRNLDPESRAIGPDETLVLTAFDETNKQSGFYKVNLVNVFNSSKSGSRDEDATKKSIDPEKIIMLNESLAGLQKARSSDQVIFTRSTFRRFPDIWTSTLDFEQIERISRANTHQNEYSWGTVQLTEWQATDGQEIEGLIYKPDNFDPNKKYPMMVYFYERNSDNIHRHYVPAAGRSIINFSFYVSRGYVVFVPDIPYKTGEPGPSAANAILPGVQHVVDQGYVDETRIGMQGHSWGGYQTAYLVTQTDKFACAESGAPVSNMTSAYGGIRWGSGMSRMFQYERTQSRIGETLWEAREKYIANSPLFFADKINTPLLILHNDEDGAVPWYQGIELFVAMRRLEKPAWLLNYNGNPHWVMGRENRLDFAKRMQQFFDHYLKGDSLPKWMATGIPAVDKGKQFGFETATEESENETGETEETAKSDNE